MPWAPRSTSMPCTPHRTCRSTSRRCAPTCSSPARTSTSAHISACSTAGGTCSRSSRLSGQAGRRGAPRKAGGRHPEPRGACRTARNVRLSRGARVGLSARSPTDRTGGAGCAARCRPFTRASVRCRSPCSSDWHRSPACGCSGSEIPGASPSVFRPSRSPWPAIIRGPLPSISGERAIYAWDGDFYAWELTRALGLDAGGGLLRIGLVHYNTLDEADRLRDALLELVG